MILEDREAVEAKMLRMSVDLDVARLRYMMDEAARCRQKMVAELCRWFLSAL